MGDPSKTSNSPDSPLKDVRRGRLELFFTDWSPKMKREEIASRGFPNESDVLCYRNCILAVLVHLPVFVNWLALHLTESCPVSKKGNVCIACYLGHFSENYWSSEPNSSLYECLDRTWSSFSQCWDVESKDQQDCVELLNKLLTNIDAGCGTQGEEGGSIKHLFQSVIKYRSTCENCQYTKDSERDHLWVIGANPPRVNGRTVADCLDAYMGPEVIEGYNCDQCKTVSNLSRRMFIRDAPEVLVVQLNRFNMTETGSAKVATRVTLAEELDITSHLAPYAIRSGETLKYQLTSVIVHRGSDIKRGHYISYVKGPTGVWTRLDDDESKTVSVKDVLESHKRTTLPYVLVYNRRPVHSWPLVEGGKESDSIGSFSVVESDPTCPDTAQEGTAPGSQDENFRDLTQELFGTGASSLEASPDEAGKSPENPPVSSVAARWEGQPGEIKVEVTMGDMVLRGVLKGFLQRNSKQGSRKSRGKIPPVKPVGISKHSH